MFFCGLFSNFYGQLRNYPIFRFGKVALLTEERIPFDNQLSELYLLETTSFGGNSGSPVFFNLGGMREGMGLVINTKYEYFLAGIIKGYFGAPIDAKVLNINKPITIPFQNAGIVAVVPAHLLLEILNSPNLKEKRRSK